jgi:hypothetical protein
MPAPFHQFTLDEFAALLQEFRFTRKINAVHMHHSWRPNHAQYRGQDSLIAMWRFDTQTNGWSDLAQHLTVAPDGTLWSGRNWNLPPCSAAGHNGNRTAGPFMLTVIGDFDRGRDRFEGAQWDTALRVIVLLQKRFGLPPESLRFHNQLSSRSCPGSAIDFQQVLNDVRALYGALDIQDLAIGAEAEAMGQESQEAGFQDRLRRLTEAAGREMDRTDPADAEPREEAMTARELDLLFSGAAGGRRGAEGPRAELPPEVLAELRPHIVNLNQGRFSLEGRFATTREDVDAMFEDPLERALESAKARGEPLRILFYAHGGLVSEENGLAAARQHIQWWQKNAIYPIYFIWETGFFETIRQLLEGAREAMRRVAPRDLWDWTSDPVIETLARSLQGPRIWSGMKHSAELASGPDGGARYVAGKLKAFCEMHPDSVQLHAIGHSAGSVFHAHFLSTALAQGVPPFRSAHFFAPALRTDAFHALLAPHIGTGLEHLTVFTMKKDLELDDHCANIYHKSLLYLIYYALEPEPKTPLLGLEVSLRSDPALKRLFGLTGGSGGAGPAGEVVWAVTSTTSGRSASRSTSHGGFDDDPATLHSTLRRILGADDNDPIVPYPEMERGARDVYAWSNQVDIPDELVGFFRTPSAPTPPSAEAPAPPVAVPAGTSGAGRRRALCVGINRYPTAPLSGCVADARSWAASLVTLGFEQPTLLLDEQASYNAILDHLSRLVDSSRAGDVLVFQYSGHGTTLPDVNTDEVGGDTAGKDEAICPQDFAEGRFLIDDDIGEVFDRIPQEVNVTCFIDCCHSGTITRFVAGLAPGAGQAGPDERPRFIVATPELIDAHRRFRSARRTGRTLNAGGPNLMKEVLFAAALSSEVAWESDGQGDFTVRATRLLREGLSGVSNAEFLERVRAAFGKLPRQHPGLYCTDDAQQRGFLMPIGMERGPVAIEGRGVSSQAVRQSTAELLRAVASALDRGFS